MKIHHGTITFRRQNVGKKISAKKVQFPTTVVSLYDVRSDTAVSSNTNCKHLGIYVSHYVGVIIVEDNCRSPLPIKILNFKNFISVLMSDQ